MELVGKYISVVEDDSGIKMDFRCTNKEIFKGIIVPPALRTIPSETVRIFLHLHPDQKAGKPKRWVLGHCEEL